MRFSKSIMFRVVMIPLVLVVGVINHHAELSQSELMFIGGLCMAIAARLTDKSLMEWKWLLITLACSLVGLLVFQEWPTGRYLSEVTLWWSIFTIPFLAFSRPEKHAKRR